MKSVSKDFYEEFFEEVEEFIALKQKNFYESFQEYFPLLVYDERFKKWKEIYYSESAPGFCEESMTSQYRAKYINLSEVENLLFERMSQVENCIALWRIVNEFVSEKLQQLSELVEVAKKQSKEYNEKKEKDEIYSEYLRLKVEEKLKNE